MTGLDPHPTPADWLSLGRRLGQGSFGEVYEAYDRRRGTRVALKVLRRLDGDALVRFKREFRAMADLAHQNLVTLYDLVSDGEQWCLTMELVEGPNLIDHCRERVRSGHDVPAGPSLPGSTPSSPGAVAVPDLPEDSLDSGLVPESDGAGQLPRVDRVCAAFAALAEGVCALHAAGILHRDLKPSNVLVTRGGRVVLLDFGLLKQLVASGFEQSTDVVGTPSYMAPEQMAGWPIGEASDWYGVGVMLYQALTGRRPFGGGFVDMLSSKQRLPALGPKDVAPDVPADLDALCRELLHPDPQERPSGADVLQRLRALQGTGAVAPVPSPARRPRPFVGRRADLETLHRAFEGTKRGRSVSVVLRGRSGMGKTALARRFLADLRQREPDLVLLAGRCYEQEWVPYKALDSLVDDLGRHLKRLPAVEAARVMPRNVLELARTFPALREIDGVASARKRTVEIPSAQELRRRAATALRDLMQRLADQGPLVLFIDDLQWGDLDSGVLLNEVLRPPEPPPLMLLVCYRSEDAERSPLLRVLQEARATWASAGDLVDVEVGELAPEEARELALGLLAGHRPDALELAETIARDSAGHPFFLNELARHAVALGQPGPGRTALEEVIRARVASLPAPARRLLEVVAVAGHPVALGVAQAVAGLEAEENPAVDLLRAARLVRTRRTDARSEIETYHDRIRETVTADLPPEALRLYYARLARGLEAAGGADPETLATHFRQAGYREEAAAYAVRGAEQAAQALAFDRAAELYRLALELAPPAPAEARALRVKLADALANAGRGAVAGEAYLRAAEDAAPAEGFELHRRAAEQLLISGHIDEGLAALEGVLRQQGMRFPRTPRRAILSLLWRRLQLAVRGLRFRERRAGEISREELAGIDLGWAVAIGLGMKDPVRGAEFQARHLLAALRAGEPYRIARALALEIGYSNARGERSRERAERLTRTTLELAERVGHPHALGLALLQAAVAANLRGHFRKAHDLCARAEPALRERCTGVTWELDTTHIFRLHSLAWMGEWRTLAGGVAALLKEAQDRGDLYLTTYLRSRLVYLLRLSTDDPAAALEEQRTSLEGWPQHGFLVQHYWDWFARGEIDLYAGRPAAAWERIRWRWPEYVGSRLNYYEALHIEATYLRARTALALAAGGGVGQRRLLQEAARDAGRIEREQTHWGDPLARLLRAGMAVTRGETGAALALAAAAEEGFRAADIGHYAAAARRRRGELLGGDEGSALVASADAWMQERGMANPARMTAMLAPGRWQRAS